MPLPTVLYAEDDPDDAFFMRHAWTKLGIQNPLEIVRDGQEAIDYLAGKGPHGNRAIHHPLPGLVLLDLRLPRVPGLDVLKWIRAQPSLQKIPVIIFSSSNQSEDINSANALRIDAYFAKPGRLDEWVARVETIANNWLRSEEG